MKWMNFGKRLWVGTASVLLAGALPLGALAETAIAEKAATSDPATTVVEWIAQMEATLVQITGVRVEETEAGLQIVLETATGELIAPATTVTGNALIAEIPNAVLALSDNASERDEFQQFEPG